MSNSNTVAVFAASGRATDSEEVEFSAEQVGFGVCLILHDAQVHASAIAHVLMPDSNSNTTFARKNPYGFSDTAFPALLETLRGISRNYAGDEAWIEAKKRLKIYLIGASEITSIQASSTEPSIELNIGKLVAKRLRDLIKTAGLTDPVEALGGSAMRDVSIRNGTGKVLIEEAGQPEKNL
jgi:chemotaxis receptor (MCP) glutamine deamidase CheD